MFKNEHLLLLLKHFCVSAVSAMTELTVFYVLHMVFGGTLLVSHVIAFSCATMIGFVLHRRLRRPGAEMRVALWLLGLFAVAVAAALFAGNNQGTVTLFWPPYRIDLSLNLVLLLLVAGFVFLHAALRALSALFDLPRQALRWRNQQKERAVHGLLVDGIAHLLAGRFVRARKSAEAALAQEASLQGAGVRLGHAEPLRALAHLVVAESAQALQDPQARRQRSQQAAAAFKRELEDACPANADIGALESRLQILDVLKARLPALQDLDDADRTACAQLVDDRRRQIDCRGARLDAAAAAAAAASCTCCARRSRCS